MPVSTQEMENAVLDLLQKQPSYQGYFTPDKVRRAINDCISYIGTILFEAPSAGWLDDIRFINTVTNQAVVALPSDTAIIREVRYKVGDTFVPIPMDAGVGARQYAAGSTSSFPSSYRIIGNSLYFNPPLGEGGTGYLMLEGAFFPAAVRGADDPMPAAFRDPCLNYCKWRAAGILAPLAGRPKDWAQYEAEWYDALLRLSQKRVCRAVTIGEFE